MSTFKCKMCGGTIEFAPGDTVGVCDSCGTQQTLPRLSSDRRENLYDRANHFRRSNEFDKAMAIYEQILSEDNTDAEAYWSLVLCRYGIEYVEDPATHQRVPTVNRAQFGSIFADEDYKSALSYADSRQRAIYQAEARAIEEIQRGILAISQQEKPFDVFICYKETDAAGRRTQDSVLANDLYHQLTNEGFRVFFSRITLEDKLGTAYEPYIFAALNSARVMVVLGTKPEHFSAVWVKNEWSRYLALIRGGAKKTLIPAYRDMDPYDLPEEFSHLQALDMSRLGFMQDLIRGIRKLLDVDEPKPVSQPVSAAPTAPATAPLLKRAFMFLEDGEWTKADEYCEQVLNLDPENPYAYLGKLMGEWEANNIKELADRTYPFTDDANFQKALRFSKGKLNANLRAIDKLVIRNKERAEEEARIQAEQRQIEDTYQRGMTYYSIRSYKRAISEFEQIHGYKDAEELIQKSKQRVKELEAAQKAEKKKQIKIACCVVVILVLGLVIGAIWKSIAISRQKQEKYKTAMTLMENGDYQQAITNFQTLEGYKDSQDKIKECGDLQQQKAEAEREAKLTREKQERYQNAVTLMADGKYEKAISIFESLGDYEDAVLKIEECNTGIAENTYQKAISLITQQEYVKALPLLREIYGYADTVQRIRSIYSVITQKKIAAGGYFTAGIKADGTVIVTGEDLSPDDWRNTVAGWSDIISISAGDTCLVGLKKDGTVVAAGSNDMGQCNVSEWKDIVAVAAGHKHTVGVKSDGTVLATGDNEYNQCNVSGWTDIVAVSAGEYHTVGLKADGTVVAAGTARYCKKNPGGELVTIQNRTNGEFGLSDWCDIVAIEAGTMHTVGLKPDGSVVAAGDNYFNQCNTGNQSKVIDISAGWTYTVGAKQDGSVFATYNLSSNYEQVISSWSDIVEISTRNLHIVGLKSDGTVVATGTNDMGQCDVADWKNVGQVR